MSGFSAITAAELRARMSGLEPIGLSDTGTTRLNLVLSSTDLTLARNYVTGAVVLNGTIVRNGNTITVTFGSVVSGAASLATATGTGALTWRPSASADADF